MKQPAPAAARVVSLHDDNVIKIQHPEASRRERLRTMAGREVGLRTGLFVVPRILSFDDSRGELVFERLGLTALREALADPHRSMELAGRVAAALAAIHGQMLPIEGAIPVRAGGIGTRAEGLSVPLHGDFGMRNIFFLPSSDHLAIIDWSNADWVGIEGDLAAPEVDLAVFLMSLFHRRAFGPWRVSRLHQVARHFLATYASAAPLGLDLGTLGRIVTGSAPAFDR